MANPITTDLDYGSYQVDGNGEYNNETLTFAGTETIAAGTILARLTADQKLVVFVKGGAAGAEIPVAVMPYDHAKGGAGDASIRAQVKGNTYKDRLIIAADGDASNIDKVVQDQLRTYGINSFDSKQTLSYDNPNNP